MLMIDEEIIRIAIKKYGTPLYLYDGEQIQKKFNDLIENFPKFKIAYSLKSNPNISICSYLRNLGSSVEVSSGGELFLALKAGFLPKDIIFNGPGKTDDELKYAISNKINSINANSINELVRINTFALNLGIITRVSVRINPKIDKRLKTYGIIMGEKSSRFGIQESDLNLIKLLKIPYVNIVGVHVYIGSQNLKENPVIEAFDLINRLDQKVSKILKKETEIIIFGGGFGIPYNQIDHAINLARINQSIRSKINKGKQYILESGRFLVGESGIYITKVIDIKPSNDTNYIIVDGGYTHLVRPYLMKTNHQVSLLKKIVSRKTKKSVVCGPSSTPEDTLVSNLLLPEIAVGDELVIHDVGAYGLTQSPIHFLSFNMPPELLYTNKKIVSIRKRGTPSDHLLNQVYYSKF